ncbi:MAG: polysaccharide biosynthesis tyrosine autokinase [Acidimicrobiales bacterium]|nr:polysaccharide biosynthesis tyrosine autokinase [Acidimicrobiales bacterium]
MADASSKRSVQDLRQFLKILIRNKALIALTVLFTVGASVVFSLTQPKRYDAQANILITSSAGLAAITQGVGSSTLPVDRTPAVEMRILQGAALQQELTKRLGYLPEVKISSTDPKTSAVITVKASAETADEAARIANDFVTTAVAVRRETTTTELKDAMKELDARSKRLSTQLAETKLRSQELGAQIDAEKDEKKRLELQFEKLQLDDDLERGTITTQLAELRAQGDALRTALDDNTIRGSYTIGLAPAPKSPSYPRPVLNAVIALATGLLLGCAIAFGRDYFNDTMSSKEELDDVTGGITVLGIVPQVAEWKHREDALLESTEHPRGPAAEAYRGLRAALDFAALDHKISLMQLTSSNAGEGKTTTAANLAVTIARADRRVILVDCDLRRPRLHQFFGLENDRGFTSVLLGECSVTDALQRPTNSPNLLVMTSGPPPPNPSELLSTKAAEELLNALTQPADMVIIDSPPLLPVADATVLARYVHSTVLVVTAGSTTKRTLERSLEILSQVDAPLEGIVFNGLGEHEMYGSGYGYGYIE